MMELPVNRLKRLLAAGDTQIGLWLGTAHPLIAEIAGGAGYDWCLIDGEHGPNDISTILAQMQALNGTKAETVVRIPVGKDWIIKQMLDIGVQNIMVPMIESAEDAFACVKAVRYPPEGIRGLAAPMVRASGFNAVEDYVTSANKEICLMVQAESRTAIENIDAISTTEGVDVVFIGPADLSADMGYLGDADAPEVIEAVEYAVGRIRAAGKTAGIIPAGAKGLRYYRDIGVTFLGAGADAAMIANTLRENAMEVRASLA